MASTQDPPPPSKPPRISPPPSQEELDQVSRDQALITDEWAAPPLPEQKGEAPG